MSVDPLAGKYPGWSSYNYCLNDPLKHVDPDGKVVDEAALGTALVVGTAIAITAFYATKCLSAALQKQDVGLAMERAGNTVSNFIEKVKNHFKSESKSGEETENSSETEKGNKTKEEAAKIVKDIGKNSITLPDGSRVDLAGKGHKAKDRTGKVTDVKTPHVHEVEKNTNPNSGKTFIKIKHVPRPATPEDIEIIKNILK